MRGGRRAVWGLSVDKRAALEHVHALVESGQLRPIIDRRYAIKEIVDAHRYVDTGAQAREVVITVTSP